MHRIGLVIRVALFYCIIIVLLTRMMVAVAAAGQNNDDSRAGITDKIAAIVFGLAWPTATYDSWQYEGTEINGNEVDITIRLFGTGLSEDGGSSIWTDVTLEVVNGSVSNVTFGANNGLVHPGATMEMLGQALVAINNDYQQSQSQSSSAPDGASTPDGQSATSVQPASPSPPAVQSQTPPLAEPSIDDLRSQTWQFLTTYWAASDSVQSQDVPTALGVYYSDTLMYYGKETDLGSVLQADAAYTARWPVRHTTILTNSVSLTCDAGPPANCTAIGLADYDVSNEDRSAHASGVTSFNIVVQIQDGHDKIIEESSNVVRRN